MTGSVEVLVILPEDLVRDVREYNLLTDETIAQLLREAVDKQVNELVNEEIRLYRTENQLDDT